MQHKLRKKQKNFLKRNANFASGKTIYFKRNSNFAIAESAKFAKLVTECPALEAFKLLSFETLEVVHIRIVNQARAFRIGSGSGRARGWILKNCRAAIGPDAGAKSRFSVIDRVFAFAGIKRIKQLV